MSSEFSDLFGNPVVVTERRRGRPAFVWTPEKSNKVKLALALGWSGERIANALAISLATLKRYFRAELKERDIARDQMELQRLHLAMTMAEKGNVGAMRQVDRLVDRSDNMLASARLRDAQGGARQGDRPAAEPPQRKLGKKAQADEDAKTAGQGSDWGDLLTPGMPN